MTYWNWPQAPSMTCTKYLKYGSASNQPFTPGQRYRNRRDMEITVPGYRDVHRQLRAASEEIVYQRMRSPTRDLSPPCTLRNNPIGYTTASRYGNTWHFDYYPSIKTFTTVDKNLYNPGMKSLYRYYGTKIYY